MSSRRVLRRHIVAAALAATALVLGACGSSGQPTATAGSGGSTATDASPVSGGTLTFGTDSDGGCIDPQQTPTAATQLFVRGVVDSLVSQDSETGELKPWLATTWTASDDSTTFTFTLRPDVTFSDGTALDAAAVKANFDRIVDPATKSLLSATYLTGYEGTTVVDPSTVQVQFSKPNAPFLQAVSTAFLGMESPASFAAGPDATCRQVVGSGPFVIESYTAGSKTVLTRNPDYAWAPETAAHTGAAYLDSVVIDVVPENGVRIGNLSSGQADAAANVPPRDAATFTTGGFQLLSHEQPGLAYTLYLNESRPVWQDADVRRAIALGIDTKQIVDTLYQGRYAAATSILTPTTPTYEKVDGAGDYDPDRAGRLLDAAGWVLGADGNRTKDGATLTIDWNSVAPTREQRDLVAQLVQAQLKQIGVTVNIEQRAIGDFQAHQADKDWDMQDFSFVRADPDAMRTLLDSKAAYPAAWTNDPTLDAALAEQATSSDVAARTAASRTAQREVIDQAIGIPIYNSTYLLGIDDAVHGMQFDPQGLPSFYDTWVTR